ncbi:hypothetical protein BDN71DRAFT_249585 [Pleurotus eryngii]|uniref:Uncharacterized protein n=1 Tax=Pleurotus eryngii TaxID=5323 RepID=A0A9P5ZLS9_PLEER|nr:hypothetical protein BDN71DRAFT_249585 [Pleurotus eryngii]
MIRVLIVNVGMRGLERYIVLDQPIGSQPTQGFLACLHLLCGESTNILAFDLDGSIPSVHGGNLSFYKPAIVIRIWYKLLSFYPTVSAHDTTLMMGPLTSRYLGARWQGRVMVIFLVSQLGCLLDHGDLAFLRCSLAIGPPGPFPIWTTDILTSVATERHPVGNNRQFVW